MKTCSILLVNESNEDHDKVNKELYRWSKVLGVNLKETVLTFKMIWREKMLIMTKFLLILIPSVALA